MFLEKYMLKRIRNIKKVDLKLCHILPKPRIYYFVILVDPYSKQILRGRRFEHRTAPQALNIYVQTATQPGYKTAFSNLFLKVRTTSF